MKVIKDTVQTNIEVKNSKFYSFLFYVKNKDEVENILTKLKDEYPNATHYCYAYIINDEHYKNDDNEPINTAGLPIYNVISKNNLNYILAVVIRYYGGIKLGSGGLVRAYTKSVTTLIKKATIIKLKDSKIIKIKTDYKNLDNIKYILKDDIENIEYLNDVYVYANVFEKDLKKLSMYEYEILKDSHKKKD